MLQKSPIYDIIYTQKIRIMEKIIYMAVCILGVCAALKFLFSFDLVQRIAKFAILLMTFIGGPIALILWLGLKLAVLIIIGIFILGYLCK